MEEIKKLRITKVGKVKTPSRGHQYDAGIDFFMPEDLTIEEFQKMAETTGCYPRSVTPGENGFIEEITLESGESVLIPSRIKMEIPKGYMFVFMNKSGIASKKHFLVGSCVADTGYEGQIHINVHNVGKTTQKLRAGEKIVQGILIPISNCEIEEVENEEILYGSNRSERGEGGFGSTGV